jgi:hypothetical protein
VRRKGKIWGERGSLRAHKSIPCGPVLSDRMPVTCCRVSRDDAAACLLDGNFIGWTEPHKTRCSWGQSPACIMVTHLVVDAWTASGELSFSPIAPQRINIPVARGESNLCNQHPHPQDLPAQLT